MEESFKRLFQIEKDKVTCFIQGSASLNVGTFYGLLFEQYFHGRIAANGYSGKFRQLVSAKETQAVATKKRNVLGSNADTLVTTTLRIPKLEITKFS
jgi:hypothetical protein